MFTTTRQCVVKNSCVSRSKVKVTLKGYWSKFVVNWRVQAVTWLCIGGFQNNLIGMFTMTRQCVVKISCVLRSKVKVPLKGYWSKFVVNWRVQTVTWLCIGGFQNTRHECSP